MNGYWATPERLNQAREHYRSCLLCEHRCGVNRLEGGRGPCKAGPEAKVFRHRVEYSEESELIPSHLFYLSGCDLRCVFCIAEQMAFDPRQGRVLTVDFFREAVAWGRQRGARTLQWVGGEPTIHLPTILAVMASCSNLPPVIWKSDFHFTQEALKLLNGAIDVYLADFKFGNDECGRRLAGIGDYLGVVTRNLLKAAEQGNLIVRHLLLPGHFDCCYRPIVTWLKKNLPDVKFSVRDGFMPRWQSRNYAELSQPLARYEGQKALALATDIGLRLVI
jgi:putative pyruvate formate lyase activating enzyme